MRAHSLLLMVGRQALLRELAALAEGNPEDVLRLEVAASDLSELGGSDLPEPVEVQPVADDDAAIRLLEGTLCRGRRTPTMASFELQWTPKYWQGPLGVIEYVRLAKLAVEARQRDVGDIEFFDHQESEDLIILAFGADLRAERLDAALEEANAVEADILEVPEAVAAGVELSLENAVRRIVDTGANSLQSLVDQMREGSRHDTGVRLEELTRRLFAQVPGFSASGRVLTETEEIDFRITNNSDHSVWRRESALLLGECKNWSTSCGREVFSVFRDKLRGRTGRVSCGFLVS